MICSLHAVEVTEYLDSLELLVDDMRMISFEEMVNAIHLGDDNGTDPIDGHQHILLRQGSDNKTTVDALSLLSDKGEQTVCIDPFIRRINKRAVIGIKQLVKSILLEMDDYNLYWEPRGLKISIEKQSIIGIQTATNKLFFFE